MIFFSVTAFAARIIVKEGCRGHAVRTVQTLLIEQGYLKGEADGIAGPMTAAAIKKFQKEKMQQEGYTDFVEFFTDREF
jgi:peptidoglycan hydrolase-like protein with peptidoglycan-binding domain